MRVRPSERNSSSIVVGGRGHGSTSGGRVVRHTVPPPPDRAAATGRGADPATGVPDSHGYDPPVDDHASVSFWLETAGDDLTPRPPLDGTTDADVAILGAGLTGLWTAYYLRRRDPALRIVIVEREIAGFGASGRNGAWCAPDLNISMSRLARLHGEDAARRMQQATYDAVDEVGRARAEAGIDAGFHKGGEIIVARGPQGVPALEDVAPRSTSGSGSATATGWSMPPSSPSGSGSRAPCRALVVRRRGGRPPGPAGARPRARRRARWAPGSSRGRRSPAFRPRDASRPRGAGHAAGRGPGAGRRPRRRGVPDRAAGRCTASSSRCTR